MSVFSSSSNSGSHPTRTFGSESLPQAGECPKRSTLRAAAGTLSSVSRQIRRCADPAIPRTVAALLHAPLRVRPRRKGTLFAGGPECGLAGLGLAPSNRQTAEGSWSLKDCATSLPQVVSSDFCHWGAQFGYTRVGQDYENPRDRLFNLWGSHAAGSPSMAKTYRDGPHPDNARIEVEALQSTGAD